MEELKVTSLEQLKQFAQGSVVKLPPFTIGQPAFVARMQNPSMMTLVANGELPNELLVSAQSLFEGKTTTKEMLQKNTMVNVLKLCDIMAEACLLEPTLKDIKEAGLNLSDDQRMAIFDWSQGGIKELKPFREKPKGA